MSKYKEEEQFENNILRNRIKQLTDNNLNTNKYLYKNIDTNPKILNFKLPSGGNFPNYSNLILILFGLSIGFILLMLP